MKWRPGAARPVKAQIAGRDELESVLIFQLVRSAVVNVSRFVVIADHLRDLSHEKAKLFPDYGVLNLVCVSHDSSPVRSVHTSESRELVKNFFQLFFQLFRKLLRLTEP
jgi:hypothetical protein